jgi:hypothetical protein
VKPVSIPGRLRHEKDGFTVMDIGAPPGLESEVNTVEAEVGESRFGPTILVLMRIPSKDMAVLKENHGLFWYATMNDHLHPFSMMPVPVEDTEGVDPNSLEAHIFVDEANNVHTPENIARAFHETYERLAPEFGYETREASAKPWSDVPQQNKDLMIAVVQDLFF